MLFLVCYKKAPTEEESKKLSQIFQYIIDPELRDSVPTLTHQQQLDDLRSHKATIKYFNNALADYEEWPAQNCAEKQPILTNMSFSSIQTKTKSSFMHLV